jgi:transposase
MWSGPFRKTEAEMGESQEAKQYAMCVGVDWASEKHDVAIVGPDRKVRKHREFEHSGQGLADMANWIVEVAKCEPSSIAVGIEVPRGAVVETLLSRGFDVFSINPKQSDRFRDRYTLPGSKNDELDAIVIADCLWTDRHLYRKLRVDSADIIELRGIARLDGQISEDIGRLGSQLRDILKQYFIQVMAIAAVDDKWLWELLRLGPTPAAMRRVKKRTLTALLKRYRIRRLDADDIIEALKEPDLVVAPGVCEGAAYQVRVLVETLALRTTQREQGERRMAAILSRMRPPVAEPRSAFPQRSEHPDATAPADSSVSIDEPASPAPERPSDADILLSIPGLGLHCASTFLTEATGPIADRDYAALRALAGVAPVTKQSGRSARVTRRLACNNRLRNAVHHLASGSAMHDPRSRAYLHRKRSEGQDYNRALRGLGDRMLKMIVSMLEAGTTYDPKRRGVPPRETAKAA